MSWQLHDGEVPARYPIHDRDGKFAAQITGLDEKTIRRGRHELTAGLRPCAPGSGRQPGGGRSPVEEGTR